METGWEYTYLFSAELAPLTIHPNTPTDMRQRIERRHAELVRRGWLAQDGETWILTTVGAMMLHEQRIKEQRIKQNSTITPNVNVGDDW